MDLAGEKGSAGRRGLRAEPVSLTREQVRRSLGLLARGAGPKGDRTPELVDRAKRALHTLVERIVLDPATWERDCVLRLPAETWTRLATPRAFPLAPRFPARNQQLAAEVLDGSVARSTAPSIGANH